MAAGPSGATIHEMPGNGGSHAMVRSSQHYTIFRTAAGFCGIAWSAEGITRFQLPTDTPEETEQLLLRRLSGAVPTLPDRAVAELIARVQLYFAGERCDFADVALDLAGQEPFFVDVYQALRRVSWGETTTYGALASAVGAGPEAARDVGQAMARNPVALIIPCHRVLAAGGKPGGFSAPGGQAAKLRMLELEGIRLPQRPVQQELDL